MYTIILILISTIFISNCGLKPEKINSGTNKLAILNLNLKKGETKKSTIVNSLGPPSIENPFNKDVIYYISQESDKEIGKDNQLKKITLLRITFSKNNIVTNYNLVDSQEIEKFELNELEDEQEFESRRGFKIMKTLLDNMRRKNKID